MWKMQKAVERRQNWQTAGPRSDHPRTRGREGILPVLQVEGESEVGLIEQLLLRVLMELL